MSTATEEATEQRYAKYAVKFVNDSGNAMPTDTRLAEVLASCVRPPKPDEYPAIREHVWTYLDGREAAGRNLRAALLDRAESYFSDSRKFLDMPNRDESSDVYAAMYRTIAGELRKVAASL